MYIFLLKHAVSPIWTVVKKEGMRDVEAIKYLPWFGQHHWRQTKGKLWMELSLPGGSDGGGTWVWPLGREDPLEEEMATHSSIHDWEIPWTEEPGGLQSMQSQRVTHELVTKTTSSSYPDTLTSPHCTWKGKAQEPFLWCEWKLKPQYCGAPFLLLRLAKNLSSMWRGYRETRKLVYSSVQFSCSLVSNCLRPHELQHPRLLCPLPTPRVHSDSCPLSQWCHPTISSSVIPSPPAFTLSQHQGLFK